MRRPNPLLAALPAGALLLAACGQPAETGADAADGEGAPLSQISIATGGTAGVYYPLGGALADVIGAEVEGLDASVEATGASVENLRLIGAGDSELAIVQGDAADQAYSGNAEFEGNATETYVLAVLYPNVYHAVSLQSIHEDLELNCFSDIEETRFSVGAVGSGNELTTTQVFQSLEMAIGDIDVQHLGYAETANALRNGQLDAGSWVVGEGHAGISELAATDDIHLIPMCDEERESVTAGYGGYTAHTISGGTYPGVDEDVETVAVWNALVASTSFNEDQVYGIVSAMFENMDDITAVYEPGTEYLVPETIVNSPLPVHPGALRFYEEQGIDIPEELRP